MRPTVCRIVRYWPTDMDRAAMVVEHNEFLAALVAAVNPNGTFNLTVFDAWGNTHARQNVGFIEHMERLDGYCSWPERA